MLLIIRRIAERFWRLMRRFFARSGTRWRER